MPVVGILASVSPAPYAGFIAAIKEGLQQTGYIEGRNVTIEYRWAEGHYDRLPQQAIELVDRGVAVIILVGGGPTIAVAKAATATIPIVFVMGDDPVKSGAVTALNRPGGNATGVNLLTVAMEAKRLQLLHELVPNVAIVWKEVEATARLAGRDELAPFHSITSSARPSINALSLSKSPASVRSRQLLQRSRNAE